MWKDRQQTIFHNHFEWVQWRTERYKCLCDANATMWGKGNYKVSYGKACIIKLSKLGFFEVCTLGLFWNARWITFFLQCNNEPWSRLLHTPPHSLAPQLHSNVLKIVVLFVKVEVSEWERGTISCNNWLFRDRHYHTELSSIINFPIESQFYNSTECIYWVVKKSCKRYSKERIFLKKKKSPNINKLNRQRKERNKTWFLRYTLSEFVYGSFRDLVVAAAATQKTATYVAVLS